MAAARDEELLAAIDSACRRYPSPIDALEEVLRFKQEKRGLKGLHVSPTIIPG